jgi:hypothetical protein
MHSHNSSTSTPASAETVAGVRKFTKAGPLARRLGLHPRTIFRYADAGLIHRHKLNQRVVLFDVAEVEAMLDQARIGPPVAAQKEDSRHE